MSGSNAGSAFSQGSIREHATKLVRSRYLVHMDKIPFSVNETDYLVIQEDLFAKLNADSFEHFILLAKELVNSYGTLTPYDDEEHFLHSAITAGWDGGPCEGDIETDVCKAVLLQQDRVISSILVNRMGRWSSLALSYPITTVGRSCFLLRELMTKLEPPSNSGVSAGILWGTFDQLLTLEVAPSKLNFEAWIQKIDLHLTSMNNAGQKASDAQIVGRILSQLQRFRGDIWQMRAEAITAPMFTAEQKTWSALKSRLLEFAREDSRLKTMNKATAALYLDNH